MAPIFQSNWWQISVPAPWKAQEYEECVEITQTEGVGTLHISSARKQAGLVSDTELISQTRENSPEGAETERVKCGDFAGYAVEYVDWNDGFYWKKWFVACRKILLFVSYNCNRSDEDLESASVSVLLSSLRCRE